MKISVTFSPHLYTRPFAFIAGQTSLPTEGSRYQELRSHLFAQTCKNIWGKSVIVSGVRYQCRVVGS